MKTIADFTDKDRIALPAVGVSVQARVLQLASAKLWDDEHYNRLDAISAIRRSRSKSWPAMPMRASC
ncbi:nitrate/sulfonate/bicarbonate ABC transporter substrate-binding protein [Bordetella pertussis]|nr:nitrate/sulfonate/bicarbonate ABC transporter substrate-binding protein [Bordetella pertussis]